MTSTSIANTDITGETIIPLVDPIPAASTTAAASSGSVVATTTNDLGSVLSAAIAGGYVAHVTGTFTVSQPIVIQINSTTQGPMGIDLGGATIVSQVTGGMAVIEIDVGPGVDCRYLTLSNFTIQGNGAEGDGIKLVAAGNDRWLYNFNINNVTVNHVGGYGLDVQGSVFEGLVANSLMTNNTKGGAYFTHLDGGQVSALHWFSGGFENNGGAGLTLDNGARDMSVDGATISGNNGVGISASQGITSVTGSTIANNHGDGVWFQNYGNFNDNTFSNTSGTQTLGIAGWQNGDASLLGNTSTDSTPLANLGGYGSTLEVGNTGSIVNNSSLTVAGGGGGDFANVWVGSTGVALPTLAAITTATTAAVANSTGTSTLETAIKTAFSTDIVAHLTANTYTVTTPIVINLTSSLQGAVGIDLGGAKLVSQVGSGSPLIEIIVGAGVNISNLTLQNFSIEGNGAEGDGIKIVADGTDRGIASLNVDNVSIEHVGAIGLDVIGNVSEGLIADSWMNGNAQGGARFANSPAGGVAGGLEWEGGGFRHNGVAGLILANGTHDMTVKGAYFVENNGPGIDATSGITLVQESGFENNSGTGALIQGSGNFTDDTFSTYGPQTAGVGGYLSGGKITLTGTDAEYYGAGADPTVAANVQGTGTLAIGGGGNIVVSSGISVSGDNPVVGVTVSDTGASSTDLITSNTAVTATFPFSNDSQAQVEALYVGYYTRAGDPAGMNYWVGSLANGGNTLQAEAAWFSLAAESQAQYPFLAQPLAATQSQIGSFITSVYEDLFNRAPDTPGLDFWTNTLVQNLGNAQAVGNFILNVIYGAQNSDQTIIANKVTVAEWLTHAFAAAGGSFSAADSALAHTLIASITADLATVVAAEQQQIPLAAVEVVGQPTINLVSSGVHD